MKTGILHLSLMKDDEIDLDVAALQLAALDHPGMDLDGDMDELDAMAASLAAVCAGPGSTSRQADALKTVLAEDYGFAGDSLEYDDPDNADMIAVIDRRLGLPITLSILYVAMARRQDWAAVPLNTPGHVADLTEPCVDTRTCPRLNGIARRHRKQARPVTAIGRSP